MVQQSNTNWNASPEQLKTHIGQLDEYVLIGKNRDGQQIVMSSGDQQLANELVSRSQIGTTESARFSG